MNPETGTTLNKHCILMML